MRSALCYGDSNTHGQIPGGGAWDRFTQPDRWPGVMGRELGKRWWIIEEGLGGRTCVHDDPLEGADKNGRTYLRPCLNSHAPLDLVIIMLGTNDLKSRFDLSPSEIAEGVGLLVRDVVDVAPGPRGSTPEIVIVSPPPMLDDIGEWEAIFSGAVKKSRMLAPEFKKIADSLGVHFFDGGSVAASDPRDGFHLGVEAHHALGAALARKVESIERWKEG